MREGYMMCIFRITHSGKNHDCNGRRREIMDKTTIPSPPRCDDLAGKPWRDYINIMDQEKTRKFSLRLGRSLAGRTSDMTFEWRLIKKCDSPICILPICDIDTSISRCAAQSHWAPCGDESCSKKSVCQMIRLSNKMSWAISGDLKTAKGQ